MKMNNIMKADLSAYINNIDNYEDSLFKYRKVNDRAKESLEKNEFYFSDPKEFRDENDCKLILCYKGTLDEIKDHFGNAYTNIRQDIKETEDGKFVFYPDRKKTSYLRVFCLSEFCNEKSMWKDYAENDKGFCIEFKTRKLDDSHIVLLSESEVYPKMGKFFSFNRVTYLPFSPEAVNLLSIDRGKSIISHLLYKGENYQFENEFRAILDTDYFNKGPTKKFAKESLKSIIFGHETPIDDIKDICKIIDEHYIQKKYSVNIYQMGDAVENNLRERNKLDINKFIK